MKIKFTDNIIKYSNLVAQNKVKIFVFDGLDGCGKGTLTKLLSQALSEKYNVIIVELPEYASTTGKLIKTLLTTEDILDLQEKMLLFAINRLDLIPLIVFEVLNLLNDDKDIIILFDRFVTSNILTISYYFSKTVNLDTIKTGNMLDDNAIFENINSKNSISDLLKYMFEIDKYFLQMLYFSKNHPIVIPMLDPEVAINRIKDDTTRNMIDKYENFYVQSIAYFLYHKLEEEYKSDFSINIIDQKQSLPEDIINDILNIYFDYFSLNNKNKKQKIKFNNINNKLKGEVKKIDYSVTNKSDYKNISLNEVNLVKSLIEELTLNTKLKNFLLS